MTPHDVMLPPPVREQVVGLNVPVDEEEKDTVPVGVFEPTDAVHVVEDVPLAGLHVTVVIVATSEVIVAPVLVVLAA